MYSAQVLDHFERPRNAGELAQPSACARLENPVCGDVLEFAIKVEDRKITSARFRARGCVASVACASKLTEMITGRELADVRHIDRQSLIESLGSLPEGSIHASHLALDALADCLRQIAG